MYAIVKAGGRQEKVTVGETITVDRIDSAVGSTVSFPAVLVVDGAETVAEKPAGRRRRRAASSGIITA